LSQKPLISLCAIVRNEAENLGRMLLSVRELVDELVIVDTGSTDGTQGIAQSFGARVYEYPWNDDFAEARNFSIALASFPSILVLDADEELMESEHAALRLALQENPARLFQLRHRHYSNSCAVSGFTPFSSVEQRPAMPCAGYSELPITRLFPNLPALRFRGRVHEQLEDNSGLLQTEALSVVIHHYGHLNTQRRTERNVLYLRLGERKIEECPASWQAHYEFALSLTIQGDIGRAVRHFEIALALEPAHSKVWSDYGHLLTGLGMEHEAEEILAKGAKRFPLDADILLNRGALFLRRGRYADAVEFTSRALSIVPNHPRALKNLVLAALRGAEPAEACITAAAATKILSTDAEAWHLLGMAQILAGEIQSAQSSFRRALCENPAFEDARIALSELVARVP
jgi:tetratricopeptide (TPR) repeat protein